MRQLKTFPAIVVWHTGGLVIECNINTDLAKELNFGVCASRRNNFQALFFGNLGDEPGRSGQ
jgi:hypothetical protein